MSHHALVFGAAALAAWAAGTFAFVRFQARLFYTGVRLALRRGLGIEAGGIPVNTIYATSALNSPAMARSDLVLTGNRDTLYAAAALDLRRGAQLLHVPAMGGRYYSLELFDAGLDAVAVVGRRTHGSRAADYVLSGPGWKGTVPEGATHLASPSHSLLLLGRVLVEGEGDLSTAHGLAKGIRLAPLGGH